jgi:hypothetical protein
MTQQVRLWEVSPDQQLAEITSDQIPLEERLEDWLESDISVLDHKLLVIGRQVSTDFGGVIDLLCLDISGNTVVIELKRGQTPREVTAQALDYASWVKDLSYDRITEIADGYFGQSDSLADAFPEKFDQELPDALNLSHRSLIVAEAMDASTDRIVRYLSGMNVPINVATVQHFMDKDGRELLAQVYLIEPEVSEVKALSTSKRTSQRSLASIRAMADANGIGDLYRQMEEGVSRSLSSQPYNDSVGYASRLDGGGTRTVMYIYTFRDAEIGGLKFEINVNRLQSYLGIDLEELRRLLPETNRETRVLRGIPSEERGNAHGLEGGFQTIEEVDRFLNGLKAAKARQGQAGE